MFRFYNKNKGFTLVELLISLAVIIIILAITVPDFNKTRQTFNLSNTARKIALVLREAESNAISIVSLPDGTHPPGYGVYINTTNPKSVILFPDTDGNKMRNGDDSIYENEYILPDPIKISGLKKGASSYTEFHIVYSRPDPSITVFRDSIDLGEGEFDIELSADSEVEKIISFWTTGQVSIVD